jgi:muconolactone delta-isomerase
MCFLCVIDKIRSVFWRKPGIESNPGDLTHRKTSLKWLDLKSNRYNMKKFMLNIQLNGLDNETRMNLLPREQEVVKELEQNGTIVDTFIKLDMSGIFIVMMAEDSEDVHSKLSTLPYYPYMKIEIIPIRVVNSVNQ